MKKDTILIIVRSDPDFERAVALSRPLAKRFTLAFRYAGDFDNFILGPSGLKNIYQYNRLTKSGFSITEYFNDWWFSKIIGRLILKYSYVGSREIRYIFNKIIIGRFKEFIVKKCLYKINPIAIITDLSGRDNGYLPEIFRKIAFMQGIKIYIYGHGAGDSLQLPWVTANRLELKTYPGTLLLLNCEDERKNYNQDSYLLGDPRESYPYIVGLQSDQNDAFHFMDDKKYKVLVIVGGTVEYSTNSWCQMLELIIDLSKYDDFAVVLKPHPREGLLHQNKIMFDLIKNLKVVDNTWDTSRLIQWADIVVNGDYCSTIFESIIAGKKVISLRGKRLPEYERSKSILEKSSVNYFYAPPTLEEIYKLKQSSPDDPILNECCWGGHGKADLAEIAAQVIYDQIYKSI